ncbi:MAG: FAD:protein FMN transferase [Flavobacteriales bacterium]|nr:FAD:protein FMN transferase [Flavobacteriales bacterium]
MKKLHYFILFLFFAITACDSANDQQASSPSNSRTIQGEAQGTTYTITYLNADTDYKQEVDSILNRFDQDISLWVPGSLINNINGVDRKDSIFVFFDETKYFSVLFDFSRDIWRKTNGSFDPTVYPLVEAWGFGLKNREDMNQAKVDSLLLCIGFDPTSIDMIEEEEEYRYVQTQIYKGNPQVRLDFNAIAQGYAVDLLGDLLKEKGIEHFMIELGGEVLCKGHNDKGAPWRIAIDKPTDGAREFQAIANVTDRAIATSGSYRKFYEEEGIRYSHTIDPRTGYPVSHSLLSATVMARDCGTADAYATAFMVMGVEQTIEFLETNPELGLDVYLIFDQAGQYQTVFTQGMIDIIEEL